MHQGFLITNEKFRERHYNSLLKINVSTHSLAVHGLKITTNEFSTNGIFCKERRSLIKKYMDISAKYDKGNQKNYNFKIKQKIYF